MSVLTPERMPEVHTNGARPDRGAATPDPRPAHRLDPERLGDHVTRLYRAAYGLCGSREEAEDLVQDTFERILRRPRFLRHENDLGYLLQVLRNTWISRARGRRVAVVPMDAEETNAIADPSGDTTTEWINTSAIYDALRLLSEPLREAVVAVDVVGLSYKDAARALGTKEGTIMSRLHRGRGQIAVHLQLAG